MSEADSPRLRRVRWYHAIIPFVAATLFSVLTMVGLAVWHLERGAVSRRDLSHWLATDFSATLSMVLAFEAVLLGLSLWFLSRITDPALPARFRPLSSDSARKGLAAGLVAVFAASVLVYVCDTFFHTHMGDAAATSPLMPHQLNQLPLGLFCIVLLGPLAEEACFRGLIMGWLQRHWSPRVGIVMSSILFALIHCEWLTPGGWDGWLITIDLFGMGLLLAFIARHTGTLWASFLAHAVSNLAAVMGAYFLVDRISL
jgi:membrane protease YdiL (CAAX protease family)